MPADEIEVIPEPWPAASPVNSAQWFDGMEIVPGSERFKQDGDMWSVELAIRVKDSALASFSPFSSAEVGRFIESTPGL